MERHGYWHMARRPRLTRREVLRWATSGATGLSVAYLAGCGSKATKNSPGAAGARSQTNPKPGGRLNVWVTSDPYDWDISYAGQSQSNNRSTDLAYESLLGFKYGPNVAPGDHTLAPKLAEMWESPDASTYVFHLRKGAKFANLPPVNGRELTSADVKFSLEYHARTGEFATKNLPKGFYAYLLEGIDRIDTPDPATLSIRFKNPFAPFLNYSAGNRLQVLPREIYDQDGHFHTRIVGSGPFQLDAAASQKGTTWSWKKNPIYHETGKPYLDEIRWLVIPDGAAAFAAFQAKQLDYLINSGYAITFRDAQTLKAGTPDAAIQPVANPVPLHMYIEVRKPPFNNVLVRRALSLALDRDEFIKTFSDGKGLWALAGAFADTFTQEEIKQIVRYDPAQAKRLLEQAGFPNGLEAEFLVNQAYGAIYLQQAELLQAQFAKVGVRLALKTLEVNEYLARSREGGNYQLTMRNKSVESDVDSYLYAVYHPNGGIEGGRASFDPTLTPLIEAQRREVEPVKRKDIVRQAVRYIAENTWHLAIFRDVTYSVWRPYLKDNYLIFPANTAPTPEWASNVWLDKSS